VQIMVKIITVGAAVIGGFGIAFLLERAALAGVCRMMKSGLGGKRLQPGQFPGAEHDHAPGPQSSRPHSPPQTAHSPRPILPA
jgi:hypothetical protein